MFLRVDFTKEPFQLLYSKLYKRVLDFSLDLGELPELTNNVFGLLVSPEPRMQLLIDLTEEGEISAHCLFTLQEVSPTESLIYIDQLQIDDPHDMTNFMESTTWYLESFPKVIRLVLITTDTRYKAVQRKYNFTPHRVIMHRDVKREER